MSKRLFLMMGIPGSGKSTWLRNHVNTNQKQVLVSRDVIRYRLINDNDSYFSKENEVFNKFIGEIKEGLENCDNVIADATHLNLASRSKLLRALGKSLKDTHVIFIVIKCPLDFCLKNNDKRFGLSHVPEKTIKNMYKSFTIPTLEEGNSVIVYYPVENKYKLINEEGEM